MGYKDAFKYTAADSIADKIARNDEKIDRGFGVVKAGYGSKWAVASARGVVASASTSTIQGYVLAGALGAASLGNAYYAGSGVTEALGDYHSTEGARVLSSLHKPVQSYALEKGTKIGMDILVGTVGYLTGASIGAHAARGGNVGAVLGGKKSVATISTTDAKRVSSFNNPLLKEPRLPGGGAKVVGGGASATKVEIGVHKVEKSSAVKVETAGLGVPKTGKVAAQADVATALKPAGKTAKEVVQENPYVMKDYLREVEAITGKGVHPKQVKLLKEDLKVNEYEKLDPAAKLKHRDEFNSQRPALRAEWARETKQKWPVYERDYWNEAGTDIVRYKGDPYDAHHLNPVAHGGPNEWWNIHPSHFRDEHPPIHGTGSQFREIFNSVVKK
jgi:hypothetical protein